MLESFTKLRVRYSETDQMGYVYYGNYAQYYEVARVDALRQLGTNYKSIEDSGVIMPVINLLVNYKKPAFYDDELTIKNYNKRDTNFQNDLLLQNIQSERYFNQ